MAAGISLAGAALIGGGAVASSIIGGKAQKKAAKAAAASQDRANELNYDMFRESRGEGGSAVLPLYLQGHEAQLGKDLVGAYNQFGFDDPSARMDEFSAIQSRYLPSAQRAGEAAAGLFDGTYTQERLNNFEPVKKARVTYNRQAAMDSLNKTLGEIDAVQAKRGFSSDSLGERMLRYRANSQANDALAGINLQNLEEERAIRDAGMDLPIQYATLPGQLAANEAALFRMPQDQYVQSLLSGQQPFQFIKIGGGTPPQMQPLPVAGPIPGPGQIAAQAFGQLGGTAMNYALQNNLANKYQNAANQYAFMSLNPGVAPIEQNAYGTYGVNRDGSLAVYRTPEQTAAFNSTAAQFE